MNPYNKEQYKLPDLFTGRTLVIATKHNKEKVIAPLFERELGVKCVVPEGLDTDLLGTFTGEVNRVDDPVTTLRKKCQMALEITCSDLVVATEGSFGPHPAIFFAASHDELVMFIDKKNGIEVVERELSMDTNFDGADILSWHELESFASKIKFPSHGIILKRSKDDVSKVVKGITTLDALERAFKELMSLNGKVHAQTDMRAMFNPTRMINIEKATIKLIEKLKSACPACGFPGYGVVEVIKGLPCSTCGLPTRSVLKHLYQCQKCNHSSEVMHPLNITEEDPLYCDNCNP